MNTTEDYIYDLFLVCHSGYPNQYLANESSFKCSIKHNIAT